MSLPRSSLVKPKSSEVATPLELATTLPFEIEIEALDPDTTVNDAAPVTEPSASELVERAAALGPARMTWESFVVPNDPVLAEKRQPHVAERRARLTRMVKMTLGACLAVCVVALGVSAVSASSTPSASASSSAPALGKTAPSKAATPIETIATPRRAKAARRVIPVATTATVVARQGKRR